MVLNLKANRQGSCPFKGSRMWAPLDLDSKPALTSQIKGSFLDSDLIDDRSCSATLRQRRSISRCRWLAILPTPNSTSTTQHTQTRPLPATEFPGLHIRLVLPCQKECCNRVEEEAKTSGLTKPYHAIYAKPCGLLVRSNSLSPTSCHGDSNCSLVDQERIAKIGTQY